MILTNENYFNPENNLKYWGSSQYKDFCGSLGKSACEAKAMAKLKGEWVEEPTTPMLIGSYVDAHFEGTLNVFKAQNPAIFTQKGDLRSDFKKANEIIARAERDPVFMKYMSGQKQVIMTANVWGVDWKIKIDSYHEGKAIVDLKVMGSITKGEWVQDVGKVNFIEFWGYDVQMCIYQKVVEAVTGKLLPVYIAAITKEEEPNLEVINIDQHKLDAVGIEIESNIVRANKVKLGELEPERCETCNYCRATKVLKAPIHYSELLITI